MPAMVSPRKTSSDSSRRPLRADVSPANVASGLVILVSVEVAIVCLRNSPYISIVNGPPKRFLNHNTNQGARSHQRALIHVRKERKFRKPVIKPLSCQNCPHGTGESVVDRCQNQNTLIPNTKSRAPKHGFWLMRGAQPATSAGARPFAGSPIPALFTGPVKEVKKSILRLVLQLAAR